MANSTQRLLALLYNINLFHLASSSKPQSSCTLAASMDFFHQESVSLFGHKAATYSLKEASWRKLRKLFLLSYTDSTDTVLILLSELQRSGY